MDVKPVQPLPHWSDKIGGGTRLLSKLKYMLTNLSYLRVIVLTKLLGLRIPYLHGVPLTHRKDRSKRDLWLIGNSPSDIEPIEKN